MSDSSPAQANVRYRRSIQLILAVVVIVIVVLAVASQSIWFWLNTLEFGELFIRPIYFELLAGLILSVIVFFRVDFKNRRSLFWWALRLAMRLLRERGLVEALPPSHIEFKSFKMPIGKFAAWQVTKVVVGIVLFRNLLFGMAVYGMMQGWDLGLGSLLKIFNLPFVTPPFEMSYALTNVIPLMPSLTLIITPLIGAIGLRILLLVGITQLARIITPSAEEAGGERISLRWRIAVVEALIAAGLFWAMFSSFFPSFIDFNSKFVIGALAALGIVFSVFAFLDWTRGKGLSALTQRHKLIRAVAVLIIILLAGSIIAVQTSISDSRKIEWLGPYTVQQIAVNRYLAEIDAVEELPYNFSTASVPKDQINAFAEQNKDILRNVRLWDQEASFAKLKPEIGLIPYVDFEDSDILRFNQTLYWSASLKPILPSTVLAADQWYASHFVYTHVPKGFLFLSANNGSVIDGGLFFKQRQLYYGEGGLFAEGGLSAWAAYPEGRQMSDEIDGVFYDGQGGIDTPPPLSWIFDTNFFWAFRDQSMHLLRYRDVYDRMSVLFPYFQYEFNGKPVDMLPVTDGANTYWLMPLIVSLDTNNVPWSSGNPFKRLVGYAIIDVYSGKIQILMVGGDYFSELFQKTYSEYVITKTPDWLKNQLRYPEELFDWRISMYNYFHVTDPATFIVGRDFYEVPEGLATYYVLEKPPGFEDLEYVGILSLELRGAGGRNLAGYMIVRNEQAAFGEMIFYQVNVTSPVKLLGPTGVVEALEKNPGYAQLKTLLRSPRIGNLIIYRIGDQDVYCLPVYTAQTAGGVVTEIGTIAFVGATFTGEYSVGLGSTVQAAYKSYLAELAGVEPPTPSLGIEERRDMVLQQFTEKGLTMVTPTSISPDITFQAGNITYISEGQWADAQKNIDAFIDKWMSEDKRVLVWSEDTILNFGFLISSKGIVELHLITVVLSPT